MNGKHGLATVFHPVVDDRSKDRYAVQLDSGEVVKVKPVNVHAEETRGASSAGGSAKSEGKRKESRGGSA